LARTYHRDAFYEIAELFADVESAVWQIRWHVSAAAAAVLTEQFHSVTCDRERQRRFVLPLALTRREEAVQILIDALPGPRRISPAPCCGRCRFIKRMRGSMRLFVRQQQCELNCRLSPRMPSISAQAANGISSERRAARSVQEAGRQCMHTVAISPTSLPQQRVHAVAPRRSLLACKEATNS
jgi:hypothetical protein